MNAFRFSVVAGMAVCAGLMSSCSSTTSTSSATPVSTGNVTISQGKLVRDGVPWVPHGYFQVGFAAGPNVANVQPFESNATNGYSPQEYADLAAAKGDSVRVLIGQPSADPQNALYSAAFVTQFVSAVQAARAAGLTVIVGIQDEADSGETSPAGLPSDATIRVWQQLVPHFKSDDGILLELFNEPGTGPHQTPAPADWQAWAAAMNMTIASVRSQGATNVVVADGLAHAETLTGAPDLVDSLNKIAYAAHPYAFQDSDESTAFLDASFGNFSSTHPVIITEWGFGYHCSALDPAYLITFLHYIDSRNIGIEMGTWDWGGAGSFGNARYNFPSSPTLSSFYISGVLNACTNSTITDGKRGPGQTFNQWYTTGSIPSAAL